MITKLTEAEREFASKVLAEAKKTGVQCVLTIKKNDLIAGDIVLRSDENPEEIDRMINGDYMLKPPIDRRDEPFCLFEIFCWDAIYKSDVHGWVNLFNDHDADEDCRWYLQSVNNNSAIRLHRKEGSNIKLICTLTKARVADEDVIELMSSVGLRNSEICINPRATLDYIRDDGKLNPILGYYTTSILDILSDIIRAIRKGCHTVNE